MLNILVVDDELHIRNIIKEYFKKQGFNIIEAEDGMQALKIYEENKNIIDIIVLDVMMPNLDGIDTLKILRKSTNIPVIMLTAKSSEEDEIDGLKNGANDYVTKPFSLEALLLRVRKLTNTENEENNKFLLLKEKRAVSKNGRIIELTNKEYNLLNYLYINKGQVLSRDMILDRLWGIDYFGDYRTVDTHIKKLRQKTDPEQNHIKTYRGVGYKFEL